MDHPSVRRQQLWEAMESCRAGADDLSDPQFADLAARLAEDPELRGQFQRLQQADEAIEAAFADVPIPAGLADRIRRRLAEGTGSGERGAGSRERGAGSSDSSETPAVPRPAETNRDDPTPRRTTGRFSRRRVLLGITALSAAAALLAAVWIETHPSRRETPDSVCDEAMEFFGNDNEPFGPKVSEVAPPAEYPMSHDIVRLQDVRWRHVAAYPGGPAVAYDLPTSAGRATLYVFQRTVPGLPSVPPPCLSTGGKSAAAWQAGELVYVLVVEGNSEMYSRYLDQSHGPLT